MSVFQKLNGSNRITRAPADEGAAGGGGNEGADDANKNGSGNEGGGEAAQNKNGNGSEGAGNGNGGGKDSLIDLDNPPAKQPAAGEKPDWLPAEKWDADKKAVKEGIDPMKEWGEAQKRAEGLRKELSKGVQNAPKEAKDYKLPTLGDGDEFKAAKEILKTDDPLVQEATKIAHKHGLSQKQYEGFMGDVAGVIAKMAGEKGAGSGNAALTPEQSEELYNQEMSKIGENGPRIAASVSAFLQEKKSQGVFDDAMIGELKAMAATAAGLKVLNLWRSDAGGESITFGDSLHADGLLSDPEIAAMIGSPAYKNSSDPAHAETHKKVDAQLGLRVKAGRPELLQV